MSLIGEPVSRVDGRAKVTGGAHYAAEFDVRGLVHAALVTSTIAHGSILTMDTAGAEKAEGVLAVITHLNAERLPYRRMKERPMVDPPSGEALRVFQDADVMFSGQPIGVVVAQTVEQARYAAGLVRTTYNEAAENTTFDVARASPPSEATSEDGEPGETRRGHAVRALDEADVRVDATYVHPREHHNAIEMHATIAAWDGDRLTLWDKTQWVGNTRAVIAHVFGLAEDHVRVISPFVGGAFGSALRAWPHVAIAALAARRVHRPVRIELSRRECYTSIGFRPHTEQRVAIGARRDGRLTAVLAEVTAQTSMYEEHAEETINAARATYACRNVLTRYRFVRMHTNTPTSMRAPGQVSGVFALECAMDELAVRLGVDPVQLRILNHADRNEADDLPWSSKELLACYRTAAERFGWTDGSWRPRALRDGGTLIGHGMATAIYPANRSAASASATLFADGTALVCTAASDMGPGTYTAMTQVAADALDLPLDRVRFELGDTDMPKAPVHGGSMTMASVGCAVRAACDAVRAKLGAEGAGEGTVEEIAYAEALRRRGLDRIEASADAEPGDESERLSPYAFGAVFVEVRIDPDLGMIRVPRIIGAYDVGRVVNPKIARSQCIGGMVGGLGMALLERADWDARFGRVMNGNLAEYLVPVHADIGELEAVFVPSDDRRFNPLGVKGLAEIAICGVAPAIANAVHHATGRRVRELPITLEKLLA